MRLNLPWRYTAGVAQQDARFLSEDALELTFAVFGRLFAFPVPKGILAGVDIFYRPTTMLRFPKMRGSYVSAV